jgi:hypothetical protein
MVEEQRGEVGESRGLASGVENLIGLDGAEHSMEMSAERMKRGRSGEGVGVTG